MSAGWHLRHATGARPCAGRLDLAFEELGSLNLKNIARPVEAFVLQAWRCGDNADLRRAVFRA